MTKLVWYFESSVVRLSACMAKYNDNKIIKMNIKVDKGQTYKQAKFIFLVKLFKHSTLIKKTLISIFPNLQGKLYIVILINNTQSSGKSNYYSTIKVFLSLSDQNLN